MECDIIIPVFNGLDITRDCVNSIYDNTAGPFNLILVDNASSRKTAEYLDGLRSKGNVTIIRNKENLGWIKAVNQGMDESHSPYLCIMNNDALVRTGEWLSALISIAESEDDIGLVNPKFSQEDSSGQGLSFTEIDFCRGYCMLIKRKVVEKTGGLDEEYGVGYYDDDDYSVRAINAGFRCVRANDVVVEHLKDSTFKDIFTEKNRMELHEKNKKLFYSKWGRRLRLIFVITKDERRSDIVETLLSAARRQHIIYLWNGGETFGINHINIRERAISKLLLSFELLSNRFKKPGKRYDAIFVDDKDAMNRLCAWGIKIYGARDGVVEKIDELSGRKTI